MIRPLPIVTGLALVVVSGVVPGVWNGRWKKSQALEAAVARLDRVPMTIGDWTGQAVELDRRQRELAGIDGYVMRRYANRLNGAVVSMLLVCGRPGFIAVHPPDVCYQGAGYDMVDQPVTCAEPLGPASASVAPAQFKTAVFRTTGVAVPSYLRILWGWSATGAWTAPDSPRIRFARSPALYKLYVTRGLPDANELLKEDPCLDFLRQLLPELDKSLFSSSNP